MHETVLKQHGPDVAIGWDAEVPEIQRLTMASYKYDAKSGRARLFFRFDGQQFNRTIRVATVREAERACALIEETVEDLKRGKLQMPQDADPAEFILSSGRVAAKPKTAPVRADKVAEPTTVKWVFDETPR
jgi:hypothetical protein